MLKWLFFSQMMTPKLQWSDFCLSCKQSPNKLGPKGEFHEPRNKVSSAVIITFLLLPVGDFLGGLECLFFNQMSPKLQESECCLSCKNCHVPSKLSQGEEFYKPLKELPPVLYFSSLRT